MPKQILLKSPVSLLWIESAGPIQLKLHSVQKLIQLCENTDRDDTQGNGPDSRMHKAL